MFIDNTGLAALLGRVATGDQAAFAALYDDVSPLVYGIAKRVVRDPAHAEEVTQETFVDLWRLAARFDAARGNVRSWAATIAHRRAVDRVRSEQSHRDRERADALDGAARGERARRAGGRRRLPAARSRRRSGSCRRRNARRSSSRTTAGSPTWRSPTNSASRWAPPRRVSATDCCDCGPCSERRQAHERRPRIRGDEPLDLLALGAAGALSDDEYRVLDELLAADPELAREYAELQTSAATLAEVSSEAPPPQLRASVLEAIRGVDQLPGPGASDAAGGAEPEPAVVSDADVVAPPPVEHHRPSNVVPIHHRRWMLPATAAAAVVMLLVGGLIINRDADAPADRMAEVLNDDDAVTIVLDGSLSGLRLVASEREDAAVLDGHRPGTARRRARLPVVGDPRRARWSAWGRSCPTERRGRVVRRGAGDDAAWAVTVEPEGGSDQPTTDPVAFSPGLF